jgi:hypothetical protein
MSDNRKYYNVYPQLTFTSITGIHNIIFEVDYKRKEVLLNTMDIKPDSPVELALLLKRISKELKEKKIDRVIQQIKKNEWDELKKQNFFKYINENERFNFINIYTETELFPEAVMKGLGFVDI